MEIVKEAPALAQQKSAGEQYAEIISLSDRIIKANTVLYDLINEKILTLGQISREQQLKGEQPNYPNSEVAMEAARLNIEALELEQKIMAEQSKHGDYSRRLHNWEQDFEVKAKEAMEYYDQYLAICHKHTNQAVFRRIVDMAKTNPPKNIKERVAAFLSMKHELAEAKIKKY